MKEKVQLYGTKLPLKKSLSTNKTKPLKTAKSTDAYHFDQDTYNFDQNHTLDEQKIGTDNDILNLNSSFDVVSNH